MKEESKMSMEELEKLEKVKLEINKDATKVNEGICPKCNEKLTKYIDNRSIFDGALTFHIIKFKCIRCNKEYLDLEEAHKYDIFLTLEKIGKEKALNFINGKRTKAYV